MNDLHDKIIIVSGGTSGIGEACVHLFVSAGAIVVFTGRNGTAGKYVCESILKKDRVEYYQMDVTDDDDIKSFSEYLDSKYGHIDGLFNNAGIYPVSPNLDVLSREFCNNIHDCNLSSIVMMTKYCIPLLFKSSRGGCILNNASIAGLSSFTPNTSYAYSASKAGIVKFTQMIAKQYGKNIRCNCICPGTIDTPIFKNFDKVQAVSVPKIPMGRTGTTEDVAKVANFLLSDDACYVNGAVVTVDGGQSL